MDECIASVGEELTTKEAMTLLDDIPEELHAHDLVKNVLKCKIVKALAVGITELDEEPAEGEEAKKEKSTRMQEGGRGCLGQGAGTRTGFL